MRLSPTLSPLLAAWLALLAAPLAAEPREWRSADGTRSVTAEFVALDATAVTLRGTDGRLFTIALENLHPDERRALLAEANGEAAPANPPAANPAPAADPDAVFDTLRFGDSRDEVLAKLKASPAVEMTVDEAFLGRVGLNGSFRTRDKIGGGHALLYFDWAPGGGLREITLQTEHLPASDYPGAVRQAWEEFATLLATLHGRPIQSIGQPKPDDLADGMFLASHLWRTTQGSILLGTAREGDRYAAVTRFTRERIQPNRTP